jgi:hypothetical protein
MSTESEQPRRGLRARIAYLLVIVVLIGGGLTVWLSGGSTISHLGPEGVLVYNVPDLASASSTMSGGTVDGISCRTLAKETVAYHVHVHVAVYVNGKLRRLPAGIGITKPQLVEHDRTGDFVDVGLYDCLYWLHTHVADGIIHVEAPAKQAFTLGQFFDIWGQPLGSNQVGPAEGKVTIFENGKRLSGNPRSTPLLAHGVIQIDVGNQIVPFQPLTFKVSGGCGAGKNGCAIKTKKS